MRDISLHEWNHNKKTPRVSVRMQKQTPLNPCLNLEGRTGMTYTKTKRKHVVKEKSVFTVFLMKILTLAAVV